MNRATARTPTMHTSHNHTFSRRSLSSSRGNPVDSDRELGVASKIRQAHAPSFKSRDADATLLARTIRANNRHPQRTALRPRPAQHRKHMNRILRTCQHIIPTGAHP